MKKNITTGGPSLFPATADAEYFDGIYTELTEKQYLYESDFLYYPHFPAELKQRAKDTFCENVGLLRDALTAKDVEGSTVDAVIKDYATLLCGPCELSATIEQMNAATKAVTPIQAFFIDRYGLFNGVFKQYLRCLSKYDEYRETVQGPNATNETKKGFLDLVLTDLAAKAIYWLIQNQIFVLDDWRGFDITFIGDWIYKNRERAAVGEYVLCYTIAKYLYKATPQELDAINKPKQATQIDFAEYVEAGAERAVKLLQITADEYAKIATPEQTDEHTKAAQAVKDWHDKTNAKTVVLHETPLIINSRSVNIAAGGDLSKRYPLQPYIDDFIKRNPDFVNPKTNKSLITPMVVQHVFDGINLLLPFGKLDPITGRIIVNTTIDYFLQIEGYNDANAIEKKAMLGGLRLFHNLYVVVERPYRIIKQITPKGEKNKRIGGVTAINILQLTEIGLTGGEILLSIAPDAMKGTPIFITEQTLKTLRQKAKGANQARFNAQLLSKAKLDGNKGKAHKAEDELTAEVFGYDNMKRTAELVQDPTARAAEIKKVKTYIQNHRAEDKKKIAKWFEEYKAEGILTYTSNNSRAGNGIIYEWEIIKPERLITATDDINTPDEQ